MNSRRRFRETLCGGQADRPPLFREGIREEVLEAWRKQGMPPDVPLSELFPADGREEMAPELRPRPLPEQWPTSASDLPAFRRGLDPSDPQRLPDGWPEGARRAQARGDVLMLRIHRGFFQTMGVSGWERFTEVIFLLLDDPGLVREVMRIQGEFAARLAERVLQDVAIDAAIFSEPIASNHGPLISPQMYEATVLPGYEPVLDALRRNGVQTLILRTYANTRILLPAALKRGFNCLWACEAAGMDYGQIRREHGRDLGLIGGIDVDVLREDREAMRREVEEKVPPLLEAGGFVPLADGRIRPYVPYENYAWYREALEKVVGG